MDILNQFDGKINGTLDTFDRIIINGYIQPLHSFRLFLYYLIQKNILLKDFDSFARTQTDTLCCHIENYIRQQGCTLAYLNPARLIKGNLPDRFMKAILTELGWSAPSPLWSPVKP